MLDKITDHIQLLTNNCPGTNLGYIWRQQSRGGGRRRRVRDQLARTQRSLIDPRNLPIGGIEIYPRQNESQI